MEPRPSDKDHIADSSARPALVDHVLVDGLRVFVYQNRLDQRLGPLVQALQSSAAVLVVEL